MVTGDNAAAAAAVARIVGIPPIEKTTLMSATKMSATKMSATYIFI